MSGSTKKGGSGYWLQDLVDRLSAAHVLEVDDGNAEIDAELHKEGDKLQGLQDKDSIELVPVKKAFLK